jgi:hypothetical protein
VLHEEAAALFDGMGLGSMAREERARARFDHQGAAADRELARLRREWLDSRSLDSEPTGELGEDRQVRVKLDAIKPTDAEGE